MTIEERADAYVGHPFEIDEFTSATIKRQAFIDGAKEQKQIDRIQFKKWYCKKVCYKRKECQSLSIMCYRLGQIVKELENV